MRGKKQKEIDPRDEPPPPVVYRNFHMSTRPCDGEVYGYWSYGTYRPGVIDSLKKWPGVHKVYVYKLVASMTVDVANTASIQEEIV